MSNKNDRLNDAGKLRKRAEENFRGKADQSPEDLKDLSPEETRRVLYELQVHQIELKMQNDELRRSQDELAVSKARYFDLYDLAPVGYFTVSEQGLILEANLTGCDLLGIVRSAISKQMFPMFILTEDQDIFFLKRKLIFETEKPLAYELRMIRPDGTVFWARLDTLAAKEASGAPVARIVMIDVTERKKNEEMIEKMNAELEERVKQRTEELATAVEELGAFTYSVSHDLKAPLRAITGFANILTEECAPQFDENGRRLIGVITEHVEKMGQLIDGLLKLCHLGKQAMEVVDIDMTALVQSVCQEVKEGLSPDRSVEVVVKPLPSARADLMLVKQIFTNLILNAMKFSAGKEKAVVEIGSYDEGREHVYYVKDNGVGFDMRYEDKLFGIFQRLHAQDKFAGTGIGLAIVSSAVRRHGGMVWAQGVVDQGATFYFVLPKGG